MIYSNNNNYILSTNNTSYVFSINEEGMPEHLHYGSLISTPKSENNDTFRALTEKVSHMKGGTVTYIKDSLLQPEDMMLEVSSTGKGDYREPFIELEYEDGSRTSDFTVKHVEVFDEPKYPSTLPSSIKNGSVPSEQLVLTLKDEIRDVELDIFYTVYPECDIITRRAVLKNTGEKYVKIHRIMSMMLDFDEVGFKITSFGGAWAREMHRHELTLTNGTFVNSTITGTSSSRNNPFVMMADPKATETAGEVYGFNLVYSGNHYEAFSVNGFYKTRFVSGINPSGFEWRLENGEEFETPEAVMSFSEEGYRGLSKNMHRFVKDHIVRGRYKYEHRPILLNSWEAAYFDINESKLMALAKKAHEAGIELFVMDDGWFKGRNNDKSSLGDWVVDRKKLPLGVANLAGKIHGLGLDFGIWVEPEMINEDSDLYRAHPEYAMKAPGRSHSEGRNQMLLDLTNPEVVEYVKNSMREVFGINGVNYVKWDMNRTFSDVFSKVLPADRQGETLHRYYLGLYDILKTLMSEFPDILFEGCSSGGNRFDLGMLSYFPQIWGSDDTDACEREIIQTGYSYGYPMSVVTAHVSGCPNHQTLRNTPIETRFNIASFGVLGYEINLCEVDSKEFEKIKTQVKTYKEWRDVFFFGDFYRVSDKQWMVVAPDKKRAVTVIWETMCEPDSYYRRIKTTGLAESTEYHVYNVLLKHDLKQFGDLINQVAPVHIKKDSLIHNTIAKFVKMDGETEDYVLDGKTLNSAGIKLAQAFGGTGYNDATRLFQDYASRMYFIEAVD